MSPPKSGDYEFKEEVLTAIRKRIGLSQGKMAELLGVPPNTLSRWENGVTFPDANSLASIFSVAKKYSITPEYFGLRGIKTETRPLRYRLIVLWDFQTFGTLQGWVKEADAKISEILKHRFSELNDQIFKAFIHSEQRLAGKELEKLGWNVREGRYEILSDIINSAKSLSGQDAEGTVLVLISNDNSLFSLIEELKSWGVLVYVLYNQPYNNRLLDGAGDKFGIQWSPMMAENSKRATGSNLP
jgi:transcriptional regulator with XRE-family HTH domain